MSEQMKEQWLQSPEQQSREKELASFFHEFTKKYAVDPSPGDGEYEFLRGHYQVEGNARYNNMFAHFTKKIGSEEGHVVLGLEGGDVGIEYITVGVDEDGEFSSGDLFSGTDPNVSELAAEALKNELKVAEQEGRIRKSS